MLGASSTRVHHCHICLPPSGSPVTTHCKLINLHGHTLKLDIHHNSQPNYYELLSVPPDASQREIKLAYHRALLRFHPDKLIRNLAQTYPNPTRSSNLPDESALNPAYSTDITLLKDAYIVLSSAQLRAPYDRQLQIDHDQRSRKSNDPRPAQVISLEDFDELDVGCGGGEESWRYGCRCGGLYKITCREMEQGHHLIACNSCSEVIWVGYQLADGSEDG